MSHDINEQIGYQVQSTAEWRRSKAKQFPNDPRNVRAAEELERLAAQIERLAGSEIHKQICEVQDRLVRTSDGDGDVLAEINTTVSVELGSIGFHNSYETGAQLLEWYRDLLAEKLQDWVDKIVVVPDLHEQVMNDPAVKTAKQVYDEAYAKAYAEARKRL